jgi:biopolymer transport protein ExbD
LRFALDRRPLELRTVFVKAPRFLNYGEVVRVIDVIKAAGSAEIGLQIEGLDN